MVLTSGERTPSGTVDVVDEQTPDVATALGTFLEVADSVHPGLVEGLYVVGSYALGDWIHGASDIDVVVVTAEPATDDDVGSLRTVHALLHERQPLPRIEGPYLAWGDFVVEPATGLHRPWVLDERLHHDGDCFEINPVTWYTLAHYGVVARGPHPSRLGLPTDTEARVRFVIDNLRTYWTTLATDLEHSCAQQTDARFAASSFVWCALGSLRLHHTAFTGDVTSKRGAGLYGLGVAPDEFHPLLHEAIECRATGEHGEIGATRMVEAARLIQWVIDDVNAASA
jgi:hypothetical protein